MPTGARAAPLLQGAELRPGVYELLLPCRRLLPRRAVELAGTRFPRPRAGPLRHRRRGAPLSCATSHFAVRLFDLSWQLTIEAGPCASRSDFCSARSCGSSIGSTRRMTVLDWLRLVERRTGTKEGCNEGDCGACTVAIGRLADGRLRYQAVNACIRFVGQLDGCQLLTVEDLAGPDGAPHPVQQAMVECHGLAMRLLHAGLRDVAVRALPERPQGRPQRHRAEPGAGRRRARRQSLPLHRLRADRRRRAADAAAEPRRARPARGRAAGYAGAARRRCRTRRRSRSASGGRRFFAPATVDALAELLLEHPGGADRRRRDRCRACGSPRTCACSSR